MRHAILGLACTAACPVAACTATTMTFSDGMRLRCPSGSTLVVRPIPNHEHLRIIEPDARIWRCEQRNGTSIGNQIIAIERSGRHDTIAILESSGVDRRTFYFHAYPSSLAPGASELHDLMALCDGRFVHWTATGVAWVFSMPCPEGCEPIVQCRRGYLVTSRTERHGGDIRTVNEISCGSPRDPVDDTRAFVRRENRWREGLDLARTPLAWPIPPTRITSRFHDPNHPYRFLYEHPGIDIDGEQGDPVRAAARGRIIRTKHGGHGYSFVIIDHGQSLTTTYGHLSRVDVIRGDLVEPRRIIGAVGGAPGTPGSGTRTTGPHLHFETRIHGTPVDPMRYLEGLRRSAGATSPDALR